MGWHSCGPSVIKHGTAVTLRHPRQTGWDNEPPSPGSAQGADVGGGVLCREGPVRAGADLGGIAELGSGLSRAHALQAVLLDSEGRGA